MPAREHASDVTRDVLVAAGSNVAPIANLRRALELLRRHFFQYERYHAVRAKEMMEARVDAVFDSIRYDSSFLALTSGADGKLQMPMRGIPTMQNR